MLRMNEREWWYRWQGGSDGERKRAQVSVVMNEVVVVVVAVAAAPVVVNRGGETRGPT